MTTQLIRYDAAVRALAACKAVDEVKDWHDKAAAMQAYGRIAKDKTLETDAAEIRIRAERRLGQMLASEKAGGGLAPAATLKQNAVLVGDEDGKRPTLADAGISYDLSSRAQKLAAVPEAQFESEVGEWRERVTQEGARVSARLEAAGDAALKQKPSKTEAPTSVSIEIYESLKAELAEVHDKLHDQDFSLRAFDAVEDKEPALAMRQELVLRHAIESRRDELMRECSEHVKTIRYWKNRAERFEKEIENMKATAL